MGRKTNVSRHLVDGTFPDPPPWPAREDLDDGERPSS